MSAQHLTLGRYVRKATVADAYVPAKCWKWPRAHTWRKNPFYVGVMAPRARHQHYLKKQETAA